MVQNLFDNIILKYPKAVFAAVIIFTLLMITGASKLEIDASAETLLLEGDKDLKFSREVGKKFEAPDYLVVTYSSSDYLLNDKNINNIQKISTDLLKVQTVDSITNITNVPLLQSPPKPISELVKDVQNLLSQGMDLKLAQNEFLKSSIYKQNLVSEDFKTTAILVNLKRDEHYFNLIERRDSLKNSKQNKQELITVQNELKQYRDKARALNHDAIVQIRQILNNFMKDNPNIDLHLGGTAMIADDMVEFVKYDLKTFGTAIVALLIIVLFILFRSIRWVVLPLFICTVSIIITSGFLGFFGWEITVISSNFISLQLIMNMSLVVHLINRYQELLQTNEDKNQNTLLIQTVTSMAKPSFFVVITTIAGFSSLVFSSILPVINFGWMMSVGIIVSLITTFILFPLVLSFFDKPKISLKEAKKRPFTLIFANIAHNYKALVLTIAIITVIFSISGATQLRVENSFIDYFKKDTEIYQGMELIDQKLGGTTPLDIIITFKENSEQIKNIKINNEQSDNEFDDFEDEFEDTKESKETYWFTQAKMEKITKIHDYLDSQPQIGKVLSLATLGKIGKILNEGEELDSLTLALIYKELPQKYRSVILTPYINIEANQARISTRIIDSQKGLQRDTLLKKINNDLQHMIDPKYEEFKVSNLLVMYNNMLQSLFNSQIKTLGVVILILFIMFLILFKNIKIGLIAITANVVPVGVIFGFMGWIDIPLDMMTITIAAISIGIAVDNTIHYIHRFRLELKQNGNDFEQSMFNSHKSIGRAMFYTSTIIMIGFSLLVLSNFIPTIYFGVLTVIAMFMAIAADLILLPVLLLLSKKYL